MVIRLNSSLYPLTLVIMTMLIAGIITHANGVIASFFDLQDINKNQNNLEGIAIMSFILLVYVFLWKSRQIYVDKRKRVMKFKKITASSVPLRSFAKKSVTISFDAIMKITVGTNEKVFDIYKKIDLNFHKKLTDLQSGYVSQKMMLVQKHDGEAAITDVSLLSRNDLSDFFIFLKHEGVLVEGKVFRERKKIDFFIFVGILISPIIIYFAYALSIETFFVVSQLIQKFL